jgi:hypothetical protein
MFEQLAGAIADTQIPTDPGAAVEAIRLVDRLGARVSVALGELDARWTELRPGEPPLATWLRRQARLSYTDAERLVLTARRLRGWPLTRRAWLDGVLSSGQIGALMVNVPVSATGRWASDERDVVPALIGLSVTDTAAALRRWAAGDRPDGRG